MELACIRAILERTASHPSSPACKENKKERATVEGQNGHLKAA